MNYVNFIMWLKYKSFLNIKKNFFEQNKQECREAENTGRGGPVFLPYVLDFTESIFGLKSTPSLSHKLLDEGDPWGR